MIAQTDSPGRVATRFRTRPGIDFSKSFVSFIWRTSGKHQFWLAALSVAVFALTAAPLEIQRRVVNSAIKDGQFPAILLLAELYLAVALSSGLTKMGLNVYRNWVGERAVLALRRDIDRQISIDPAHHKAAEDEGVEMSLIVSEAEPVGLFVGSAASEPMLQGGLLLSILGYMAYLQPLMALMVLGILSPQIVFVPLMQRAITKRAAARIVILRSVSVAIVKHPARFGDAKQRQRFDDAFELNMGIYKLKFSMNFLMNFMRHLGVFGILALGGWLVVNGRTEIGTVVAFLAGLSEINDPWGELVNWFRDMQAANVKYGLIAKAVEELGRGTPQHAAVNGLTSVTAGSSPD